MNVLCTGGAGFIGSNLVKRCVEEGWNVDIIDDMSNGHTEFLHPYFGDRILFYRLDFASREALSLVEDNCYDVVFHLAAQPRVCYSIIDPVETVQVNLAKTVRFITEARGYVGRIVFASSSSVYGNASKLPTPELQRRNPRSPYALSKAYVEDCFRMYDKLYVGNVGFDSVCLRFFNIFGPNLLGNSQWSMALPRWLDSIHRGVPMCFDGDMTQSRDMCYVDNVVDACIKAATHLKPLKGTCINIGSGVRTTNDDIMKYLLKRYPSSNMVNTPLKKGDVTHTHADVTKAKKVLGYVPKVDTWEGIERTIRWYDDNWTWIKDLKLRI